MNKVMLTGRLTREPEIKFSQGEKQTTICNCGIAVDRRREGVDFFNVVAFNSTATFMEKYMHKGSKVVISGRLNAEPYTNKEGRKVTSVQVIIDEIEFAESKRTDAPQQTQEQPQTVPADIPEEEEMPWS